MALEELEEGNIVLATVDRIKGTLVFVNFPDPKNPEKSIEGSIILSEIAPGRIRNIRNYVFPGKQIPCKILRISDNGRVELSLRRVSLQEKKELLEEQKQEKKYRSILKTVCGKEKADEIIKKVKKESENSLVEFFSEAQKNEKKLEEFLSKENAKKVFEILQTQKPKRSKKRKEISINSKESDGIETIKDILLKTQKEGIEISYISAGKYSLQTESENIKEADKKLKDVIEGLKEKVEDLKQKGKKIEITE